MHSPELLLFVENCPKGAETLVTRVIHILTDKGIFLTIFTYGPRCDKPVFGFSDKATLKPVCSATETS